MGLMNKLKFWKHEAPAEMKAPEMGLGREHDLGLGLEESSGPAPPGMPPTHDLGPAPEPQPAVDLAAQAQRPVASPEKDIEVLNAKVDALKAVLDSINQRLANIERIANESQGSEKHEIY